MVGKHFSSGDLLVDRRAEFAETLAYLGDLDGAIQVLRTALDLVPEWGAGWFRLGEYHERAGDLTEAASAWGRAVAAQPDDPFGAGLRRDLLRDQPLSESMPPAFVEMLFDQYAPRFEASLVQQLEYRGPEIIADALAARSVGVVARGLDLGCGTGLAGPVMRSHCTHLTGVDLSQAMLDEAEAKGVYDRLEKADIQEMPLAQDRYGLIVAADVFIYLGALERIIGWCSVSLEPGGVLIFTVELSENDEFVLLETRRFAHSRTYILNLLSEAGFASVDVRETVLRKDRGTDILGLCVIAEGARDVGRRLGDGEAHLPADA